MAYIEKGGHILALGDIPDPSSDPEGEARAFYTAFYSMSTEDSSLESRKSLINRLRAVSPYFPTRSHVLDLGAGRGIVEEEYLRSFGQPNFTFITTDISNLSKEQLFAKGLTPRLHIQSSGVSQPFPSSFFPAVVSNLALDFMPNQARSEVFRTAKPGSPIILNLHHPSIIPPDLEDRIERLMKKIWYAQRYNKQPKSTDILSLSALKYKKLLQDTKVLFSDADSITIAFSAYGFVVKRIELGTEGFCKWWEVDLQKPF